MQRTLENACHFADDLKRHSDLFDGGSPHVGIGHRLRLGRKQEPAAQAEDSTLTDYVLRTLASEHARCREMNGCVVRR